MANDKRESFEGLDLLGETDPKIDADSIEKLVTARIGLLLKQPFFGNIATRFKIKNADDWCQTAATDGRHFYYNSRFIQMLRQKEIEFLFGHETLHAVYEHVGRCKDGAFQPDMHNVACDYVVNADLIKHGVGEKITTVPCLYDSKFNGWSSEAVYEYLYDNAEKIDMNDLVQQLLDEHLDGSDDGEGGDDDGKGKKPRLSQSDLDAIRRELKEAVLASANTVDAGNLPAGIRRMLKDLTEPQMDWREILRMNLESTMKSNFSWMKPSRRGWHCDAVLPGMVPGEMVDIVVAIDTSGSMTDKMIKDFLSEIQGIMEAFDQYCIKVFTFDTKAYGLEEFTSENLEQISMYDAQGGGGTDFNCCFDFMKENAIEPERFVMFTDGYPYNSWGDETYCETLFVIHGDPEQKIVAPFGMTAWYTED